MLSVLEVAYAAGAVSPDAVGGAEQVLATLDAGLVAAGHRCVVVAPAGSRTAGRLAPTGPAPELLDRPSLAAAITAQRAALLAALAADGFDLIHLHGLYFDHVLPVGRPPAVVTLHLPPSFYPPGALARRPGLTFVCVSEAQARSMPAGAPLAGVVPNGVPLDRYRPGGDRDGYALVLSRIAPEKGVHLALDAARRAGVPLLLAGAVFGYPEHRAYFEAELRPRLDGARRFIGPAGEAEKRRLLARARCVVIPSLAPETSSLVAMEALASGTPVVARRVGALPEIVEDGRTGLLVDGVQEMAEAIRDAASLSPADCRRAAEARFSAEAMVSGYRALYGKVAGSARRRGRIWSGEATSTSAGVVCERARVERSVSIVDATPSLADLDGVAALEGLAAEWGDLADRDPAATAFQRPEWLLPYCRAFGVRDPWAVALRVGGRLAALAPLVIYPDGGCRIATLLGGGRSDWQDALVDPGLAPQGAAALLARIAARGAAFDRLLLERLPADGWLARAPLPDGLELVEEGDDEPCPVLALPGAPEALIPAIPAAHVRRNVRQGRRKLFAAGRVELRAAGPDGADAHARALATAHGLRWTARGGRGVLAEGPVRGFLGETTRAFAASGRLRGFRLELDGRLVAVFHGLLERDRLLAYLCGFDPAFAAASPGAVLLAHVAEEAIREGARALDLLRGRERYKYDWGAVDRAAARRVLAPAARGADR